MIRDVTGYIPKALQVNHLSLFRFSKEDAQGWLVLPVIQGVYPRQPRCFAIQPV